MLALSRAASVRLSTNGVHAVPCVMLFLSCPLVALTMFASVHVQVGGKPERRIRCIAVPVQSCQHLELH